MILDNNGNPVSAVTYAAKFIRSQVENRLDAWYDTPQAAAMTSAERIEVQRQIMRMSTRATALLAELTQYRPRDRVSTAVHIEDRLEHAIEQCAWQETRDRDVAQHWAGRAAALEELRNWLAFQSEESS